MSEPIDLRPVITSQPDPATRRIVEQLAAWCRLVGANDDDDHAA